jgi:hypothetical protein
MAEVVRVSDGSKFASFDGYVLEVSGLSGSANVRRVAVETIESVALALAGDELMFGVRSRKGGFGVVVSPARRADWEALITAVNAARSALPR